MKITIITLFPQLFKPFLQSSLLAKAQEEEKLEVSLLDLRDFGLGPHRQVDDRVYGGGIGMILRVEPIFAALRSVGRGEKILLTPQGKTLNQETIQQLVNKKHLILLCGKYEGVDERVRDFVDQEISIGDYVLSGGEVPAMVLLEAIARLIPGVLDREATESESFRRLNLKGKKVVLLEPPQYTRPDEFKGKKVPKILLSGDHPEIKKWREAQSLKKTKERRPDLLKD